MKHLRWLLIFATMLLHAQDWRRAEAGWNYE